MIYRNPDQHKRMTKKKRKEASKEKALVELAQPPKFHLDPLEVPLK